MIQKKTRQKQAISKLSYGRIIGRRKFLKTGLKASIDLALVAAGAKVILGSLKPPNPPVSQQPRTLSDEAASISKNPSASEKVNVSNLSNFEIYMFKGHSQDEINTARKNINHEVTLIKSQPNYEQGIKQTLGWQDLVEKIVKRYTSDPTEIETKTALILAVIFTESRGFPYLEAHQYDPSKITKMDNPNENIDQGLAQIKRATAKPFARKLGYDPNTFQLKDPETNLDFFMAITSDLEKRFNGLAPIIYNWGEGNGCFSNREV